MKSKSIIVLIAKPSGLKGILVPERLETEQWNAVEKLVPSNFKNDAVAARKWRLWAAVLDPDWTGVLAADPPDDGITLVFVK